jgi:hypothetical protein
MEPESPALSPYLLVFRDRLKRTQRKTSPREIGTVLSKWIEWQDSLEALGRIRFRGAIGSETRLIQGPSEPGRYQVQTEQTDPIVGYLLIDAANFEEATEIAAGCPGLREGFAVEVCERFVLAQISDITATDRG